MLWLADSLFGPRYQREIARARAARAEAFAWAFVQIGRGVAILAEKYRRWRLLQATIRDLRAMDAHLLRDIGVTRDDISTVAEQLVYGKPKTRTAGQAFGKLPTKQATFSHDTDRRRTQDQWRHAA